SLLLAWAIDELGQRKACKVKLRCANLATQTWPGGIIGEPLFPRLKQKSSSRPILKPRHSPTTSGDVSLFENAETTPCLGVTSTTSDCRVSL
ncbi:hypothetical protein DOTSEDRAFT_74895, partial [Dothistroma septosporum NZE10]